MSPTPSKMSPATAGVIIVTGLVLLGLAFWAGWFFSPQRQPSGTSPTPPVTTPPVTVTNYDQCVRAGYPVQESYPARCAVPQGATYTQDIGNALAKQDLIVLESPKPGTIITSPFTLAGKARGSWFFEASFPIELKDANGKRLATGVAQAQSDWMTTAFVTFKATLTFTAPATGTRGTLILRKDNPSGLVEHDDQLTVPIRF